MTTPQVVAIAVVLVPALAFVLWPLVTGRREGAAANRIAPADAALELNEEKTAVYRALKELAFDHEAGHLSDDDYEGLRARYESRAAEILAALDALGPACAGGTDRRAHRRSRPGARGPQAASRVTRRRLLSAPSSSSSSVS